MPFFEGHIVYRHIIAFLIACILVLVTFTAYQVYVISDLYANQRELCKFVDRLEKQSHILEELENQQHMLTLRDKTQ